MDRVTLSSQVAIIVVGLPGSGKSFFAKKLAASLDAPLVSNDKIRWMLFAHHTYDEKENKVVRQTANMLIAELLKTRKTFVLDGGYNDQDSRTILASHAKKAGYNVLTVAVQTDALTAKMRSTKRNAKTVGDRYKQPLSHDEFNFQSKQYQAPSHTDKATVVISGKHTYSTQARAVLKKMLEIQGITSTTRRPTPEVRAHGPFVQ